MKKIYRVVKHTYYEKGEINKEHYTIQCQTKFLWWKLWDNITDIQCHDGDCETYPIMFYTEKYDEIYGTLIDLGYRKKFKDFFYESLQNCNPKHRMRFIRPQHLQ